MKTFLSLFLFPGSVVNERTDWLVQNYRRHNRHDRTLTDREPKNVHSFVMVKKRGSMSPCKNTKFSFPALLAVVLEATEVGPLRSSKASPCFSHRNNIFLSIFITFPTLVVFHLSTPCTRFRVLWQPLDWPSWC